MYLVVSESSEFVIGSLCGHYFFLTVSSSCNTDQYCCAIQDGAKLACYFLLAVLDSNCDKF